MSTKTQVRKVYYHTADIAGSDLTAATSLGELRPGSTISEPEAQTVDIAAGPASTGFTLAHTLFLDGASALAGVTALIAAEKAATQLWFFYVNEDEEGVTKVGPAVVNNALVVGGSSDGGRKMVKVNLGARHTEREAIYQYTDGAVTIALAS